MKKDEINFRDIDPKEIKAYLDRHIVGQDRAKMILSVAVYNHYKKLDYAKTHKRVKSSMSLEKSNILMLGPSGVGKTALIKALADKIKVPFVICDATEMTEAGYVGRSPESCITRLLQAARGDIASAETGIIYIDEIDKLACINGQANERDVGGEGVQQGLLKLIEGTRTDVGVNEELLAETVPIDTSRILFIVGGAFVGIDHIICRRVEKPTETARPLGFCANVSAEETTLQLSYNDLVDKVQPEDFCKFGIIPELMGRLPIIVPLHELNAVELRRILTEPRNALVKQYQKSFLLDDVNLKFSEDALEAIVEQALRNRMRARGLRTIMESLLLKPMFNIKSYTEDQELIITKQYIDAIFSESGQAEEALPEVVNKQKKRKSSKDRAPQHDDYEKIGLEQRYEFIDSEISKLLNPKTITALKIFKFHINEYTELKEAKGNYEIVLYMLTDCWLHDIDEIINSIADDKDGRVCSDVFWSAIITQIEIKDYFTGKLLGIRALPLLKRYGDTIKNVYDSVDAFADYYAEKSPFIKVNQVIFQFLINNWDETTEENEREFRNELLLWKDEMLKN